MLQRTSPPPKMSGRVLIQAYGILKMIIFMMPQEMIGTAPMLVPVTIQLPKLAMEGLLQQLIT